MENFCKLICGAALALFGVIVVADLMKPRVRVIRCRDCRFFKDDQPNGLNGCARNGGVVHEEENGFCSHAQPKDQT